MSNSAEETNTQVWHKRFAMSCNNRGWDLSTQIRTPTEDREMLNIAHASAWHWGQIGNADWELAFTHAIYAHAAHAAGRLQEHREAYGQAVAALEVVANEEERKAVAKTFSLVPRP